ncbi:class I SAM-dependent methyltransferase [candidate division KSB1 bacterium]
MANHNVYPDFFAQFYDVIYEHVRSGTDQNYFLNKILDVDGAVLEVGVGTGRLFTKALSKGADIYGIDINKSMIDVLKQKIEPSAHFRIKIQDVTKLKLNKNFPLIIAPFRVFSHLVEIQDQLDALNAIYDHISPGGKLIFDLFVPNLEMIDKGLDRIKDFEGEYKPGKKLTRITSMKANLINQISDVKMQITWDDEKGNEITKDWLFKMRFFFRFELEHLIARSKLQLETIYGDYDESPLEKGSKEFIIVCKRP